ncbi:MAG: response regulator transcription factor [Gammaproteobacteria bacterium]|jgi:DNA-binding NarL/FixJ family response regulator|nr:response regulator transcription factor [Gammaproteobacteria bacterium]
MIRLLIIDDHAIVRRGLRHILAEASHRYLVGEADNANEGIRMLREKPWDIVLLDMNLPGKSGLEALKQIRSEWPEMKVLILTVDPEDHYALRALRYGAAGYLTKSCATETLLAAIQRIGTGGKYITQSLAEKLAGAVTGPTDREPHETLTDREFQVCRLLATGKTVSQVATELSLSVKTISTHRSKVLHKLGLRNNAELMRYYLLQMTATTMHGRRPLLKVAEPLAEM